MLLQARRGLAPKPITSLSRVHMIAAVERSEPPSEFYVELGKLGGARLLVLFQKT
jgi:hypothetical protein